MELFDPVLVESRGYYQAGLFSNERVESLFKSDGISKDESSIRTKELEIYLNNHKEPNS